MANRIGLIGAGFMGATHAAAYSQIIGADLVAVADANTVLADKLASEHGLKAYYDIDSLLEDSSIEAVDICLPTFLHERYVIDAAKHGKHVLCEKPIALSIEQVEHMISAVESAGVMAMVGQVVRFWPEYVVIRDLLQHGDLGDPRIVSAFRLSAPPKWGKWFKDPALSGGAVIDLHVHDLDFIYSLFGMPSKVYASGMQSESLAWDQVQTVLSYDSKLVATAEASFLMPDTYPFHLGFRLQGGEATVEYHFQVCGQVGERAQADRGLWLYRSGHEPEPLVSSDKDAYLNELEYWVSCLNNNLKPDIATLNQAKEVLRIALSARASLETGEIVNI